jgi:hypothetical protein
MIQEGLKPQTRAMKVPLTQYSFEMGLLCFRGPKSSVTRHLGIKPSRTCKSKAIPPLSDLLHPPNLHEVLAVPTLGCCVVRVLLRRVDTPNRKDLLRDLHIFGPLSATNILFYVPPTDLPHSLPFLLFQSIVVGWWIGGEILVA